MSRYRAVCLAVLLQFITATVAGGQEAAPILKFSELQPGMTGEGKTVLRGLDIETFQFTIIDTLEAQGFASNLILVRCHGPVIEKIGGIAAGMSGSPLYVDGKNIGAVAFTTPFADTSIGYATPIEDILQVFELRREARPTVAAGSVLERLPAGTPIMVAGVRGRALDHLSAVLRRYGHRPVAAPVQIEPNKPAEPEPGPAPLEHTVNLQPGSAVACSLTTGDMVITAVGTVSYRDGDRIWAFGHPFLQRGDTSMFMHPAYIYEVVPSIELPFKIGAPAGPPVGAWLHDRTAALGGLLGRVADSFPVTIVVRDRDLNRTHTYTTKVIQDEELAPLLTAIGLIQGMSEVMDRAGGGTAELTYSVSSDSLEHPLRRTDLVYSETDIIEEALGGPLFTLDGLMRNDFAKMRPTAVNLEVEVNSKRRTTRLVDLTCEPTEPKVGEQVLVTATMQPYRGPRQTQRYRVTVPPGTAGKKLMLEVSGRPRLLNGPLSPAVMAAVGLPAAGSLAELAASLSKLPGGNVLTCELRTVESAAARQELLTRLRLLPGADLFGEVAPTPTAAGEGYDTGLMAPLVQQTIALQAVVQGRLSRQLTVAPAAPAP